MTHTGWVLKVLGGLIFLSVILAQMALFQKQNGAMQKSFKLLLAEKKSMENHVHSLESRVRVLFERIQQNEHTLHAQE